MPDCVPAGTRSSSSPSRVGRTSVVPSAAWTIDTVHRRHQVVADPRVPLVRLHPQMDIEVARFTATWTDRAAPGEAEGGAVVDAGRHVHLVGLVLDSAGHARQHASHGVTMSCPKPAAARAGRGGHHLAQQALAHPAHLAGSGALGAGHRLGARRGAVAVTGLAPNGRLDRHGEGRAEDGVLEGDVGLDLEILPTGRAGRAGIGRHRTGCHRRRRRTGRRTHRRPRRRRPARGRIRPPPPRRTGRTWPAARGSDRTSYGARDGLEPLLGRRITRIGVRVELPRPLPVGALDVLRRGVGRTPSSA